MTLLSAHVLSTLHTHSGAGSQPTDFLKRVTHLVGALCHGWPQSHHDLRLICKGGQLSVQLFSSAPASAIHDLLGHLPEHGWQALAPGQVSQALAPFPVRDIVLLQRKASEPLIAERGLTLWSVRPLGLGLSDWALLSKLTEQSHADWLLSVRIHPTTVNEQERNFVLSQQGHVATLQARAGGAGASILNSSHEALVAWRQRLEDACAEVTITLAAADILPLNLSYALRGWLAGDAQSLELIKLDPDEACRASRALETLETVQPTFSKAPQGLERLPTLYNPLELASLLPFPPTQPPYTPGWPCLEHPHQPLKVPLTQGLCIGESTRAGTTVPVCLEADTLSRHTYAVGRTGTGKTTLLKKLALTAMQEGRGVIGIDPHGDLHQELLRSVPEHRQHDVHLLDPFDARTEHLNFFDVPGDYERRMSALAFGEIIQKLTEDEYGREAGTFLGPVYHLHLRMAIQWLTSNPDRPGTVIDLYRFFTQANYYRREPWFTAAMRDTELRNWHDNTLERTDFQRQGMDSSPSTGNWMASKFTTIAFHPALRPYFDQVRSSINLDAALNKRKIILINLSKGRLGETASRFLGMLTVHLLFQAFLRRAALPEHERQNVLVVADEFQGYATQAFLGLLSEGRKFGLQLALANQFLNQLPERLQHALLGNVGTLLSFRVGVQDAELLRRELHPNFTPDDLINLPNFTAAVRTLHQGQPVPPFTLRLPTPVTKVKETNQNFASKPREVGT